MAIKWGCIMGRIKHRLAIRVHLTFTAASIAIQSFLAAQTLRIRSFPCTVRKGWSATSPTPSFGFYFIWETAGLQQREIHDPHKQGCFLQGLRPTGRYFHQQPVCHHSHPRQYFAVGGSLCVQSQQWGLPFALVDVWLISGFVSHSPQRGTAELRPQVRTLTIYMIPKDRNVVDGHKPMCQDQQYLAYPLGIIAHSTLIKVIYETRTIHSGSNSTTHIMHLLCN